MLTDPVGVAFNFNYHLIKTGGGDCQGAAIWNTPDVVNDWSFDSSEILIRTVEIGIRPAIQSNQGTKYAY